MQGIKKVVLYGASLAAEKFYCKNRKRFEIEYIIDQKADRLFHNIPVYTYQEKKQELHNKYIIVTVETLSVYNEIKDNLNLCGAVEYKNYIFWKNLDKKLCILYGNCHFTVLTEYLNNNRYFNHQYFIKYYSITGLEQNYPNDEELAECDLLIVQDIRKKNYLNAKGAEELICKTSKNAKVIRVPNLYGYNLYFPQAKEWCGEEYIKIHRDILIGNSKNVTFEVMNMIGVRDENLEQLIDIEDAEGIEDINNMIENEEVYSLDYIQDNFQNEILKIKERENLCDIKISDYILNMYQKIKLFYDPYHPSNEVIHEKGRRILELLNLEIDEGLPYIQSCDSQEMIIYGCVERALKLEFKDDLIRKRNSVLTFYKSPIDRKEYIEMYINWSKV